MTVHRETRAASFGAGAAAYARSRPDYPEEAIDWLVPQDAGRVLDLGAGTGKLTAALAARGLDVVAVDPSEPMLAELSRASPYVEALVGSAEAIPLPDATIDAVTVAQAWHWVDPERAAREIVRVLRPRGSLGLVWNTRDKAVPWMARFERIIGEAAGYDGTPTVPGPFSGSETLSVRWEVPFDVHSLLDLVASRSAFLVMAENERWAVLDDVRAFFQENAGATHGDPARPMLAMPYVTRCFRYRLT